MRGSSVKLVPKSSRLTTESTSPWAMRPSSARRCPSIHSGHRFARSPGRIARRESGSASSRRVTMGWACGQLMRVTEGGPGLRAAGGGAWLETEPETRARKSASGTRARYMKKGGPDARAPCDYTDLFSSELELDASCTRRLPARAAGDLREAAHVRRVRVGEQVGVVEQVVGLEAQLHRTSTEADALAEAEVDVPVTRARAPRRARSCRPDTDRSRCCR